MYRKGRHRIFLLYCFLTAIILIVSGCGQIDYSPDTGDRIKVVASIFPLADFVRHVGGERVEVMTLLPPAASPHVFSPSPKDLTRLRDARLFVKVGLGFEFWAENLAHSGAGKGLAEVETSQGIEILQESEQDHNHDHSIGNPHIWLDPLLAMEQVNRIEEALSRIDPGHRETYRRNAAVYKEQLQQLHETIEERVRGFQQKSFVAFHPSWAYFAKRYHLIEAGVIEVSPGREPTPGEMIQIVRTVRETGAKVVFAEPQLNPKAAYVIASEIGAEVLILDPIGSPDHEDRSSYLKLMAYNLMTMEKGMGNRNGKG